MSFFQMSDMTKMFLFVFLGLIFAILVLGYHKSPQASPALGTAERARIPPATRTPRRSPYPSNESMYK